MRRRKNARPQPGAAAKLCRPGITARRARRSSTFPPHPRPGSRRRGPSLRVVRGSGARDLVQHLKRAAPGSLGCVVGCWANLRGGRRRPSAVPPLPVVPPPPFACKLGPNLSPPSPVRLRGLWACRLGSLNSPAPPCEAHASTTRPAPRDLCTLGLRLVGSSRSAFY